MRDEAALAEAAVGHREPSPMLNALAWLTATTAASSWTVIEPPQSRVDYLCTSSVQKEWRAQVGRRGELRFAPRTGAGQGEPELVWAIGKRGRLIGNNRGLAGGSLDWLPAGGGPRQKLLDITPIGFAQYRGDIFVAAGLSHRIEGDGSIYRLRARDNGRWQIDRVLDLQEAPLGTYAREGEWTLVTAIGVTHLDLRTLQARRLHTNLNWWQLGPSSIVGHKDRWYIGARRGVVRLTPDVDGYREQWMVPSDCRSFTGDCQCAP